MTILDPATLRETTVDPRDPLARLEKLFDPGSLELLHTRDKSGVLAAVGESTASAPSHTAPMPPSWAEHGRRGMQAHRLRHRPRHRPRDPRGRHLPLRCARLAEGVEASTPSAWSSRPWSARPV